MPVAVAPVPARTTAQAGCFYALVKRVHTGLFSSKVNGLNVEVLSGSVERGETIEVVREDGSIATVVAHRLREAVGEHVLDLDEPHSDKAVLAAAAVARTPGVQAPSLPAEACPEIDHLLNATRRARALGFPVEWAQPITHIDGPTPEWLSSRFRLLPDEAVALVVQHRLQAARGHHDNPFTVMLAAKVAAMHLGAIGLPEDGDRLLLLIAAAVQGHSAPAAVRATASAGAMGVLATENVAESGLLLGKKVGMALGIEMGDTFAKAFQSNVAVGGEVVEAALLEAERAVGVGWCKSCRDIVQLRFTRSGLTGSPQLRCPADNHKVDDPVLVVPADAAEVQKALRAQVR